MLAVLLLPAASGRSSAAVEQEVFKLLAHLPAPIVATPQHRLCLSTGCKITEDMVYKDHSYPFLGLLHGVLGRVLNEKGQSYRQCDKYNC